MVCFGWADRMTFKPMPLLTVLTIASLVILVLLGNWQYARYSEKKAQGQVENDPFETMSVEIDTSNDGFAQQVYGIVDGEAIWRRYVPGRIDGEGPVVLLLWDAVAGTDPVPLQISGLGNFEGRANAFERPAQTNGLAGSSNPQRDLWYGFNAGLMLNNLGYSSADSRVVEPDKMRVVLGADMSRVRTAENPYATLTGRDPLPPERHFGYALTWWGMALGLIGVYIAFHRSQGRLRFGGSS